MSDEMKNKMAKLKSNYIASLPEKISAIRSLWSIVSINKDINGIAELHRMSHNLAGSGATYGQVAISENAKNLGNYINDHSSENVFFNDKEVIEIGNKLYQLEHSNVELGDVSEIDSIEATLATMDVTPMRILLADDDADIRQQIKLFLESRGHTVYLAKDGNESIDVFEKEFPDLILMDVVMPGVAGYDATKILKEKSVGKFIPIIFLTSNSDDKTLARCISAGGDDFLTKPVNLIILNSKLQALQRIIVMYDKLDDYQRKTEEELETSKHVFNSLINTANDNMDGLSCWADSPGHFSGDTRLYKTLENGHIYVLLCDFTGHGLPAAIGTVFAADLFRSMTQKNFEAVVILNEINSKMNQILPTGRYCAAIMLDYDPSVSKMKIWNSGLPTAYLVDADNNITQEFPSSGVPLGVIGGEAKCDVVEFDVEHDTSIIIFSDGITEAENPEGEMYSEKRLLDLISDTKKGNNIFSVIQEDVELFMKGTEPTDDISLVVLNFNQLKK